MKAKILITAILILLTIKPVIAQDESKSAWQMYLDCIDMEKNLLNEIPDYNSPYTWDKLSFNTSRYETLVTSITFFYCDGRQKVIGITDNSLEETIRLITQLHNNQTIYWKVKNETMTYLYEVTGYYDKKMTMPRYIVQNFELNNYNNVFFSESIFAQN